MSSALTDQARAKINLTLHVLGRRADCLHDLESLVAFADLCDIVTLHPGQPLGLTVTGPTAQAAGPIADNLVLRAANALAARVPGLKGGAFELIKQLPPAAGMGGGSSDAAAALRLLARANNLMTDDERLFAAAADVGADVPVCVRSTGTMMRGAGERLSPPIRLPSLHAVLVNPGIPAATAPVFAELGLKPGEIRHTPQHCDVADGMDAKSFVAMLERCRNDLEAPAIRLVPEIADVLEQIRVQHRCQLARMTGSGATCFGLFPTMSAAFQAVRQIRKLRSHWWVQPAMIGG